MYVRLPRASLKPLREITTDTDGNTVNHFSH